MTLDKTARKPTNKRTSERVHVMLPARLTWKDQRGAPRFASVITRDVSEHGVFVEVQSPVAIPLFRLAQFQLEREARDTSGIPAALRHGRLLAAVYRVHPPTRAGGRQGLALRLMVDPRHKHVAVESRTETKPDPIEASVVAREEPAVTI
ncbi:MAG: hypothetical protein ABMA15_24150 [Vicinamibacterales bacterium]